VERSEASSSCPEVLGGAKVEDPTMLDCRVAVLLGSNFGLPATERAAKLWTSWAVLISSIMFRDSSAVACVLVAWSTSCVSYWVSTSRRWLTLCSSSACNVSKMKGACDSHCCDALSSLAVAASTFWAFALPPFLFSLSDLSCASSSSFAMLCRLPEMLLRFIISFLVWKLRSGTSTSFSIRWENRWWEAAMPSVDCRILSHGDWKTLRSARQCTEPR
jgi:hypothetical protein